MSDTLHMELTIRVSYDLADCPDKEQAEMEIRENLEYIATNAANNGLMSGDGPALVDHWEAEVKERR